jgi:multiple sugar transport system ATP-binding protein
MTAISLQQLDKTYRSAGKAVRVVKDLSLEIADKEFLVLLGPSGCGKTTTMRMVAGLEEPTGGAIAFDGKRINELPTQQRDVAMVFQNYGLYPHMTVAQNIGYPLKLRKLSSETQTPLIAKAAQRVELTDYLHRYPRELSGGQRQRVALGRSIVRTPSVFLMDEPLSNLDAKLRVAMRSEIKHLAHELQVTTIYVTHDQVEAMTLANRVALMKNGEIQQLATPEVIYNDPANTFVAGFIGSPAMNLLPANAIGGKLQTLGGVVLTQPVATPQDGGMTVGVRAEDASLCDHHNANLIAPVFSCELLGDVVMVTVKLGGQALTVKAEKTVRLNFGELVGIALPPGKLFWFDAVTGSRIRSASYAV